MNDNILEFKTVQANAFRILVEALKDILTDVNLIITPDGLKIISMDGSKNAVIYLKLESSKFETFNCSKMFKAGLNMSSLHKIIKSIKNSDVITVSVSKTDTAKLKIVIENKEKRTKIITKLKLLDIDDDILEIPNIEFDSVITMPSNDFQSYIRELSIISNKIEIESINANFILRGRGDFADTEINIGEAGTITNGLTVNHKHDAKGTFNIKFLLLFTKSTNLCTTVEIYLKDEYPLILIYHVANLGKLQYCLAPLNEG